MEEEEVTRSKKSSVFLNLIFSHKCQVSHHLEAKVYSGNITPPHPPLAATSTGGSGGEEVVYKDIPGGQ